jgi:hypothetical protein
MNTITSDEQNITTFLLSNITILFIVLTIA